MPDWHEPWFSGLIGLVAAVLAGWLVHALSQRKKLEQTAASLADEREQTARLAARCEALEAEVARLQAELETAGGELDGIRAKLAEAKAREAHLSTRLEDEQKLAREKLKTLEEARDQLRAEFKELARQIFTENSRSFHEASEQRLDAFIRPVREQIAEFRKRLDALHESETRDRAMLRQHLEHLEQLNRQMSDEARHLTQALKGESKAQGNWGEMVLERILEASGLREGKEFVREQTREDADGRRLRPDVIVRLPGDKHVVIDAKVSLTHYQRALAAATDAERAQHARLLVESFRRHVRELAAKRYDRIPALNAPDYVLMFVPVEGAYLMAIEAGEQVFEEAFRSRVAIVTPSTLYATLRLIEQLWRHERQSENVLRLLERAAKLHDKMAAFTEAFAEVGQRLEQARRAYETAEGRLTRGRGNVLRQIEQIGELSGLARKELPRHMLGEDTDESD